MRRMAQRDAYAREQFPDAERLRHVIVGACVERVDLGALLRARGQYDDRHRGPAADAPDHLDAVDVRQPEVDDREIGLVGAGVDCAAFARVRLDDAIAFGAERGAKEGPDLGFVLDDQDRRPRLGHSTGTAGTVSSGSVKRNAAPCARRSAQILPPCRCTTARQIASPRPTPPSALSGAPRWNFANNCSGSPGGSPGPRS